MSISEFLKLLKSLNSERDNRVENRRLFDLIWHILLLKSARFINLNLHSYYSSQYHIYVCLSFNFWHVHYINFDVILNMFMLSQQKITMNSKTQNWRFKIRIQNFEIFESKIFDETLKNHDQIFVLICANVTQTQFDCYDASAENVFIFIYNQLIETIIVVVLLSYIIN